MAAETCDFTYQEETFTIGYDYITEPFEGGEVKHIFTIEGEGVLYTLTRSGVIDNVYLVVKHLIDEYNAFCTLENKAEALKASFEDIDGNLDTYLSENPTNI
jgi:hypothetical protein